jgi:carbon storage regulator
MLVLTRRLGQQVQLGDDIRLTVVRITDGSVRIGIEAPESMSVMRQELLDAVAKMDSDSTQAGC